MSGIINIQRRSYSTSDWICVKTHDPFTSFGPMPVQLARQYAELRGGEAAGYFLVPDPDAEEKRIK
jgi:hypothetical protein